jgi:hypothetical protein
MVSPEMRLRDEVGRGRVLVERGRAKAIEKCADREADDGVR